MVLPPAAGPFYSNGLWFYSAGTGTFVLVGDTSPLPVTVTGSIAPGGSATARGSISLSGTVAGTVIASPGTDVALFITSLQFSNTGGVSTLVTLNDTKGSQYMVPAGGGNNSVIPAGLQINVGTPLLATPGSATSNVIINAQGFYK